MVASQPPLGLPRGDLVLNVGTCSTATVPRPRWASEGEAGWAGGRGLMWDAAPDTEPDGSATGRQVADNRPEPPPRQAQAPPCGSCGLTDAPVGDALSRT